MNVGFVEVFIFLMIPGRKSRTTSQVKRHLDGLCSNRSSKSPSMSSTYSGSQNQRKKRSTCFGGRLFIMQEFYRVCIYGFDELKKYSNSEQEETACKGTP